jgi:hypothetical protein
MHLLYTDEVNVDPRSSDFFIYGGVSVDANQAASLSRRIDVLRQEHGYRPEDLLKFNTRERPAIISPEIHKEIKRRVIEAAAAHGAVLFASFILHDIATSPEEARLKEINRVCYNFDCFLQERDEFGIVLIDTFTDSNLPQILRERFSIGLSGLPYSDQYRLERVLGFHLASIGSSHFSSVVDIVLGSLRYAVNCLDDASRRHIVQTLLSQLAPLCLRNDDGSIRELSLFFSPVTVRVPQYYEKYQNLRNCLTRNGLGVIETRQELGE